MKRLWADNPVYKLTLKLIGVGIGMFVFAIWIMPPIYDVFCEITGLNGKTGSRYQATDTRVNQDRLITVQFVAINNETMPWNFTPEVRSVQVHPGEQTRVNYHVHNTGAYDMVGQAIPSLVPFKAATYFHKTECFCFEQQPLRAGESAELPFMKRYGFLSSGCFRLIAAIMPFARPLFSAQCNSCCMPASSKQDGYARHLLLKKAVLIP